VGISRKNLKTVQPENMPPNVHGIQLLDGIAHKNFIWNVRTNKNILNVFANLHGSDQLFVSFDRFCFVPPPETFPDKKPSPAWPHVDQNEKKIGLHCLQGLVTLGHTLEKDGTISMEPTVERDATLCVMEKTHLNFDSFFEKSGRHAHNDWYRFTNEEYEEIQKNFKHTRVTAPPGSLFLWDSRTVHYGGAPIASPQSRRPVPSTRLAIYVCYQPSGYATEYQIKKKVHAYDNYLATNHWPVDLTIFDPYKPRTETTVNFTVKNDRVENETMLKLSGKTEYTEGNGVLGWTEKRTPMLNFSYW